MSEASGAGPAAEAGPAAPAAGRSHTVVDHLTSLFVPQHTFPDADPSDAIIYMAQLDKAMAELKDENMKALAKDELKFFKMAVAIIATPKGEQGDDKEYFDAIHAQFGTGIEAVKRLAQALKEVAMKDMADKILKKTMAKGKVTDDKGARTNTVESVISGGGPFHY